jgi:hypothetical protein
LQISGGLGGGIGGTEGGGGETGDGGGGGGTQHPSQLQPSSSSMTWHCVLR